MKNLNFPGLPRILIIDDEEGIREGLRTLLQAEGVWPALRYEQFKMALPWLQQYPMPLAILNWTV